MPKGSLTSKPVDVAIGNAIRTARTVKGVSQTALGEGIGVTFQQVQKYESGTNRLSVSTLIRICQVLNLSPMDIIGPLVGQPSAMLDTAEQITTLKRRLADIAKIASKG